MSSDALAMRPTKLYVDPTTDHRVLLVIIDDELVSAVVRLTPASAARLAYRLLDTAADVEHP